MLSITIKIDLLNGSVNEINELKSPQIKIFLPRVNGLGGVAFRVIKQN